MTIQNYLIVQNNVVTDCVVWDGGPDWNPPEGSTALVQATTPALLWLPSADKTTWVLTEVIGAGQIGFTWNGTVLTTNQPEPTDPPKQVLPQPTATGVQTA